MLLNHSSILLSQEENTVKPADPGILSHSICFSFTPSETTRQLLFYPTWCGHYYCTDRYYIDRPFYPPLLVMYICRGVMHIRFRGHSCDAHAGDIVLIDCAQPHYYRAENGAEFLYMHFDGSNSHELSRYIIEQHDFLIQRNNNYMIRDLLSDMVDLYTRNEVETDFDSSMRIYRILEILMKPTDEERANSPVDDVIQYIRANISNPITLEELADVANLSVYYFAHCFKEETGFAPLEYVINTRIERAKALLLRTSMPISEIAYEVGYRSAGSLSNAFLKRVGVSPGSYRLRPSD